MQSLKYWNAKVPGQQTFANFRVFMRQQHRELKKVGGLTIQNSSLNMMKEIKMNQEKLVILEQELIIFDRVGNPINNILNDSYYLLFV